MHAKLGRNNGRYDGESIPILSVEAEIHEAALRHGWSTRSFLSTSEVTLRSYQRLAPGAARNIYISSGIHGDEPSGPLALLQVMQENAWPHANLWVVPCLNPTGFLRNTRENADGVDLNRDYRHPRTAEIRAHVQWLKAQPPFDLSLLLHEDWEANGFYVYELNPENRPSLAEPIVEAVRAMCPVETADIVDSFQCRAGIIRPDVRPEDRPQWAEAVYLMADKSPLNYTLETPSDFVLPLRVATHVTALKEALARF